MKHSASVELTIVPQLGQAIVVGALAAGAAAAAGAAFGGELVLGGELDFGGDEDFGFGASSASSSGSSFLRRFPITRKRMAARIAAMRISKTHQYWLKKS